ncbi:MAG: IS91 family transposase [Myxococcota bacterium]
MRATLQQVFRRGFDAYARTRRLPRHVTRAARDIQQCRSAACGRHLRACPDGHTARIFYNSCRHRACPQCSHARIEPWVEARAQQLLPCDHYHVIFTVPHPLEPLWHRNRARMNDLLFRAARETLLELLGDPKYLGARPGVLAALHTWGRTLSFHPHIHALVTGGGWHGQAFKAVRNGFLLPFRVVRSLFRGKFVAAIREALAQQALVLPAEFSDTKLANLLRRLERQPWNVHVSERYAHALGVAIYLGRYLRGGPIANSRLLGLDADGVRFRYTDHRDGGSKEMRLPVEHFIQRVVWHIPEPGKHLIRYWGLYARGNAAWLAEVRDSLGPQGVTLRSSRVRAPLRASDSRVQPERSCPVCGQRLVFVRIILGGSARAPPLAAVPSR